MVGLEIVIAEDADGRNLERADDLLGQRARFFRQAKIRQVTGEDQDVGNFRDLGEERLQRPLGARAAEVKISDCRDTYEVAWSGHPVEEAARAVPSAVELAQLLINGRDRLLEHRAMVGSGRSIEIGSGPRALQLQGLPALGGRLLLRSE